MKNINEPSLLCGDCLELMKQISDGSIDMILTDPPYNISQTDAAIDRSGFKSAKMRRARKVTLDFGEWDNSERGAYIDFTRAWFRECSRCLRDGGSFVSFFSLQDISLLAWIGEEYGIRYRTFYSWIKKNPMPSIYRRNYLSAVEIVFFGSKGDKPWTFNFTTQAEMHNVFYTPNKSIYGVTDHPCEKPVSLLERFIQVHTNKDFCVLDPFMGSGSTGVACVKTRRRFIGIEKDEKFFETAKKRIEEELSKPMQETLF